MLPMLPSKSSLKLKQKCIFEFPSRLRAKNKKRAMEKVAKRAYFKFQDGIKSIQDKH